MKIEFTTYEQKFNTCKKLFTCIFGEKSVDYPEYDVFNLVKPEDCDAFIGVIEQQFEDNKRFTKRMCETIVWRFRDGQSLKEIARKYHIPAEKVRGFEALALRRFRHPQCSKKLILVLKPHFEVIDARQRHDHPEWFLEDESKN